MLATTRRLLFGAVFLIVLEGCRAASAATAIRLSDLQPLATPPDQVVPLRVAVAAVISPQGTAESYQRLLDYLSAKLARPVELVQRRTYAEINELIERGEVDMAFVCTSAYVAGRDDFGMQLLAAPQVAGESVYYSLLIVAADSPARSIVDLRGTVFVFTDPMSTTGRMYPSLLVQELGSTPDEFFARTFFTYSHDDAIRAVAAGLADGAAVDSLVYEFGLRRDLAIGEAVRVIHRSPAFGIPPVVVGPDVRPQTMAELQALLLAMADDPEGRAALAALDVDRFVPADDADYDSVRALLQQVGQQP